LLDFQRIANMLRALKSQYSGQFVLRKISEKAVKIADGLEAPLKIMVMGEFSTGKSTLINAIIGQNIATVDATPTTAVITVFLYGEDDKVLVHSKDGTVSEYNSDKFSEMTSKNGDSTNSNFRSTISYVERFLPLNILKKISIVDSPGFNDIDEEHVNVTRAFTDSSDVVLWILSSEQAGKNSEVNNLKSIGGRLRPLLVVNKIDIIDEEEQSVEEFI